MCIMFEVLDRKGDRKHLVCLLYVIIVILICELNNSTRVLKYDRYVQI